MFENFSDLLLWATGVGLPIIVGIVMSLFASRVPQWDNLPSTVKAVIPFIVAVLVAYVGKYLNVPAIVNNEHVAFIFDVCMFYLASQYQNDRNNKRLAAREEW